MTGAVLRGVTAVEAVAATDLEPLYENVEVDALEAMVRHADDRDARLCVEFTIGGCDVRVHGDGTIRIDDDPRRSSATNER